MTSACCIGQCGLSQWLTLGFLGHEVARCPPYPYWGLPTTLVSVHKHILYVQIQGLSYAIGDKQDFMKYLSPALHAIGEDRKRWNDDK